MSLQSSSGPVVTFGLFDWVDADGVRDASQLYRERLDLLADAESQGFDVYHLAEHHGTPLGPGCCGHRDGTTSPARSRSAR